MDYFRWLVEDTSDPLRDTWSGHTGTPTPGVVHPTGAPTATLTVSATEFPVNTRLRLTVQGWNRAGLAVACAPLIFWIDHTPPDLHPGTGTVEGTGVVLPDGGLECRDRLSGPFRVTWEHALEDPHSGITAYFWALGTPASPEKYVPRTDTVCGGGACGGWAGMHWKGGEVLPPLQGAQPMPSHCLP